MSGVLQNKPRHMVRAFFYKRPKNIQVAWAEITMLSMDQNDWVGQNVLSDVTGKPERTFWPTQYIVAVRGTLETRVRSLGQEDPLEEGTTTHSSILAWSTPWTEEPGGYSPWRHKESDWTEAT